MNAPFDDARWDTFGLIKEAFLALDERLSAATAATSPVDRSVLDLLIRVARSPDTTARPTDLAQGLSMVPSHITRCLDAAERDGLIERRAHPTDRRSTLVVLAPAGRSLLAELEPTLIAVQDRLIHGYLSPEHVATLEGLLRSLRDRAHADAAGELDEGVSGEAE